MYHHAGPSGPGQHALEELIHLSHALGTVELDWASVAEGNVSTAIGEDSLLVKASGSRMRSAASDSFVGVRLEPLVQLLDDTDVDDVRVREVLAGSVFSSGASRMPSVETLLHVVCVKYGRARYVVHTHPTDVNAFLCSTRPELLVQGNLFPDQIVVLGRHQLLVPYVDPGLQLARRVRVELEGFARQHGSPPRVIYLANHGMFALGSTAQESLDITEMAAKTARVLRSALSLGGAVFMSDEDCERIDTRPDEVVRRRRLQHAAPLLDEDRTDHAHPVHREGERSGRAAVDFPHP